MSHHPVTRRQVTIAETLERLGGLDALARVGDIRDQVIAFVHASGGVQPATRLLRGVSRNGLLGYMTGTAKPGTILLVELSWRHHVVEGRL
jgi:hypothetical protein